MIKESLGSAGAVVSVVSYLPYLRDIARRTTVPHVFSWLTWSAMTGIGFAAQVAAGGGPGVWVNGVTSAFCLAIFVAALFVGDRSLTRLDKASLAGAVVAAGVWPFTEDPLLSVIIVTLIDSLGYVPTFRKTFHAPHTETLSNYVLSGVKFALAALAMERFNVVTALFPVTLLVVDAAFIAMVVIRRRQIRT